MRIDAFSGITGFTRVALHDYYFGGMMRLCDDELIPQYRKTSLYIAVIQ